MTVFFGGGAQIYIYKELFDFWKYISAYQTQMCSIDLGVLDLKSPITGGWAVRRAL